MQQTGDELEEEEVEEEPVSTETPPEETPSPAPFIPNYPKGKVRKSGRKGALQNNSQLTFEFPEYEVGIFAGDPENIWNGVNVDIPTFRRMNEVIDKGT